MQQQPDSIWIQSCNGKNCLQQSSKCVRQMLVQQVTGATLSLQTMAPNFDDTFSQTAITWLTDVQLTPDEAAPQQGMHLADDKH